jgi:hypothetical protein
MPPVKDNQMFAGTQMRVDAGRTDDLLFANCALVKPVRKRLGCATRSQRGPHAWPGVLGGR